ncbi:hypothetical protein C8R45DRAFT_1078838 [Mycena sanguinolenta]|nr:hypothetical protein C8R45DRAFT_1078838 [Mycena sanguinolenta]
MYGPCPPRSPTFVQMQVINIRRASRIYTCFKASYFIPGRRRRLELSCAAYFGAGRGDLKCSLNAEHCGHCFPARGTLNLIFKLDEQKSRHIFESHVKLDLLIKPDESLAGEHMDGVMYLKPAQVLWSFDSSRTIERLCKSRMRGLFFLEFSGLDEERTRNSPPGYHLYVHEKREKERLLSLEHTFQTANTPSEGYESPEVMMLMFRIPTHTELRSAPPICLI